MRWSPKRTAQPKMSLNLGSELLVVAAFDRILRPSSEIERKLTQNHEKFRRKWLTCLGAIQILTAVAKSKARLSRVLATSYDENDSSQMSLVRSTP